MDITNLLARRYIFPKRSKQKSGKRGMGFVSLIAWFAMMGIMLGVATLILVTSLMNGIKEEMLGNFIGIDGHLRIQAVAPQGGNENIADYGSLIAQITPHLPQGSSVSPRIEGQVMVTGNNNAARGAQVMAMRAEDLLSKTKLQEAISLQQSNNSSPQLGEKSQQNQQVQANKQVELNQQVQAQFANGEGVIIGARMADALGLLIGDAITLISPNGQSTAFGTVPRIKAYPVIATLELGMHALDSSLILMPYDKAIIYFAPYFIGLNHIALNHITQSHAEEDIAASNPPSQNPPSQKPASYIEITLADMNQSEAVGVKLQHELGAGYAVYPWQRIHQSVFSALQVQRNVMVMILMLIVLVAAFNIISSLVMLVKDKNMDIAILRTLGASKLAIAAMFVKAGMMLGTIGTMLGLTLGLVMAHNLEAVKAWIESLTGQEILVANIYFLSTLPTKVDIAEVAIIICSSLLISLLATIYPAIKAAGTQPAEALRHG